jgi:hypothetical protein
MQNKMRIHALGVVVLGIVSGCAPYNHHFYDIEIPDRELSNRCGIPETASFPFHGIYMQVQVNGVDRRPGFRLSVSVPAGQTARFLSDVVVIDEPVSPSRSDNRKYQLHLAYAHAAQATTTGEMRGSTYVQKHLLGDIVSHETYYFNTVPEFFANEKVGEITLPSIEVNGVEYPPLVIPYRATSKFIFASLNGC